MEEWDRKKRKENVNETPFTEAVTNHVPMRLVVA